MAERKNAWDNILEDFGWMWGQGDAPLTREQLSIPNILPDPPSSPLPPAPPVEFLSPQKRANASRDRRVEKPDAQTRMAGIGPAPLEADYPNLPFGLAISPDMPIATVPPGTGEMAYGISPDISKDTLDKAVADLQSGDRTRKGGMGFAAAAKAPVLENKDVPFTGDASDYYDEVVAEELEKGPMGFAAAAKAPLLDKTGGGMGFAAAAEAPLLEKTGNGMNLTGQQPDPFTGDASDYYDDVPVPFTGDASDYYDDVPVPSDIEREPKQDEKPDNTINDPGTGKSGPIASGLKEDADEAEKELNWLQRQARDRFGMDDDQRSDLARALIQGGAATMMGSSPHALQNIGAGIMEGADTYYQEGDDRRTEAIQDEALQMKREAAARQAEAHGLNMEKARAELKKAAEGAGIVSPTGDYGEFDQNVRAMMQRYPNMTITEAQQYVLQRMTDIHKATADSDI